MFCFVVMSIHLQLFFLFRVFHNLFIFCFMLLFTITRHIFPLSGEAADTEIKVPSEMNSELKGSPLKPGVGHYIAIRATLTARDFFLAYFDPPVNSPAFFPKHLPIFPLCWLWLTRGSCVGLQNKIDHPAGRRFPC